MARNVDTGLYSAYSLERALLALEEHYGMGSETFMRAHRADDAQVARIAPFHRHTWSSYYMEWRELTHDAEPHADPLATQIERELEPA